MSKEKAQKPDINQESASGFLIRFLLSYVFAFGFPFLAKMALKSHLSIVLILMLVMAKPSLAILAELTSIKIRRTCTILSSIYSFLFAFLVIIGILITPADAYSILFKEMQANSRNPGRLSNLFVLFLAFFSTTFSCTILKKDYAGSFLGMSLIISLLYGLIFQFNPAYLASVILILLCLIYIAHRYLDKGYRVGNVLISIVIIGLCLGLGFGLHSLVQIERSKFIDDLSTSLRGTVSKFFPQIPLMYELPEYGFSFDDEFRNDLGSTPVLSNIPLFEVRGNPGDKAIYLRTRIHDQFENNKWETPAYNIFLGEKEKNKNPEGIEPETGARAGIPSSIGTGDKEGNEIAIVLLGEYYHLLPQTLDTVEFRFRKTPPKVIFGDFDKGFYFDNADMLLSGDIIYLRRGEKEIVPPVAFTPYLKLPVRLSSEIKQMASTYEIITYPRDKIAKIKQDLILNYTYNVDTGGIRKDENFLDTFLFKTKEGYSVHFATALIIIARYNKIPARYATGFLAIIPQPWEEQITSSGFKTTISGLSAHVWPEIWYDDTGWTIEEATPAVNPDFYSISGNGIQFNKNINLNLRTRQQISALMGEPVVPVKETKEPAPGMKIDPVYLLYGLAVIVLILFFFRYAYIIRYAFRKNIRTIIILLKKIIKKQKRKGFPLPEEVGWIEWGEQIKQNALKAGHLIGQFITVVVQIMYGGFKVNRQDVKTVFVFYRKVKTRKRKSITSFSSGL